MIKKILLSAAVPIVFLMAIAGCGHSNDMNNTTDMTNATPATMATTNSMPTTNTDMMNTNLSTNCTMMSTNNP